jgi:hypothetical protein
MSAIQLAWFGAAAGACPFWPLLVRELGDTLYSLKASPPAGGAARLGVLHDLAIPGSAANIDHLVIGPGGVVVIDTKQYRGRLYLDRYGLLWHGRHLWSPRSAAFGGKPTRPMRSSASLTSRSPSTAAASPGASTGR